MVVSGEGGQSQLVEEAQDGALGRPDPTGARVDVGAVATHLAHNPPAHPVAGLEHRDRAAVLTQPPCRGQTGDARTHDEDIDR